MRFAPNVAWREFPLRARLEAGIGLPVIVENDANVAAWGEFRFGAGRGSSDMLLITVGTGIGGGIVAGGQLFRGAHGFAAEVGHIIVEPGGPRCGCGNQGCWEQVASGRAIGRLGQAAGAEHPESTMTQLAGGASAITGPIVTEAAKRGDPIAVQILADVGRRLGEGIAGLVERPGSRRGRRGRRRDRGRRPVAGLGEVGVRRFRRGAHPSSRGADPRGRAGQRRRRRRRSRPGAAAGSSRVSAAGWPDDRRRAEGRSDPSPVLRRSGEGRRRRREAESLGYDGVFGFDHLFQMDRTPETPSLEVFTMLAAAAAATRRIAIGTLITRAALRPPAWRPSSPRPSTW